MKILNEYPGGHHYWEEYLRVDYFCPNCGKQEMWADESPGDYYCGSGTLCIACGFETMMQGGPYPLKDANDISILEQLRTGITKEPTTRKGS